MTSTCVGGGRDEGGERRARSSKKKRRERLGLSPAPRAWYPLSLAPDAGPCLQHLQHVTTESRPRSSSSSSSPTARARREAITRHSLPSHLSPRTRRTWPPPPPARSPTPRSAPRPTPAWARCGPAARPHGRPRPRATSFLCARVFWSWRLVTWGVSPVSPPTLARERFSAASQGGQGWGVGNQSQGLPFFFSGGGVKNRTSGTSTASDSRCFVFLLRALPLDTRPLRLQRAYPSVYRPVPLHPGAAAAFTQTAAPLPPAPHMLRSGARAAAAALQGE